MTARRIEAQMLWILGSPRTGSSWLLELLACSPRVVPVNEPLIGMYLSPFLIDRVGWHGADLDQSNFTLRRALKGNPHHFFAPSFEPTWLPALASLMKQRFAHHALRYVRSGSVRRCVLAIKEPNGSESADVIMRALPRARLLFLVRDPRDVVDSELAAHAKGAWLSDVFPGGEGIDDARRLEFVRASASKWLWRTEVVQQAYAAHTGPKLTLHYEALLADPNAHLLAIFRWLGIPMSESEARTHVDKFDFDQLPSEQKGPDKFHRAAQPGLWRQNLTTDEQRAVNQIAGEKMVELGYTADPAPG